MDRDNAGTPLNNIRNWRWLLEHLLEHGPQDIGFIRKHPHEVCVLNGYATEDNGQLAITEAGKAIVLQRRKEDVEDARYRNISMEDWWGRR